MSRNSADCAATERARTAQENIFPFGLHAPRPDLFLPGREWPGRRVLKNVAVIHAERLLDVDWALAFDAKTSIARDRQAIFERLVEPLIDAREKSFFRLFPHRLGI